MWLASDNRIGMVEGDWGIQLPVSISGVTLTENDALLFTFKEKKDGAEILTKEYSGEDISENTVRLEFTAAESALFPAGSYVYSLDWYQSGSFMCNVVRCGIFRVEDKA